jgi:hypothetical protein
MLVVTDPDDAFRTTIDLVEDYLNKGMLIPPFLLRNLIDGVRGRLNNLRDTDSQLASKQAEFVKEKLGKLTSYNFKWRFRSDVEANTGVEFDFLQFSRLMLLAYIGYKKDHPSANKRDCVEFIYESILDEVLPYLDKHTRQALNKYRLQVIVGTLTIAAGYKRSYPHHYTIKEIKTHVQHLMKVVDERRSIPKGGKK